MSPRDLQALVIDTMTRAEERIKTASDMGMGMGMDPMSKMDGKKKEDKKKEDMKMEEKEAEKLAYQVEQIIESLDSLSPTTSALSKLARKAGESAHVPNELSKSEALSRNAMYDNEHRDAMAVGEDPGNPGTTVKEHGGNVPNELMTTIKHTPGGKGLTSPPLVNKAASFKAVLEKLSETVPNEIHTFTADESGKGQTGYDASGYGNENRHLIESTESAINYTKADAKRHYNKSQLGQVFDEVHPEKDTAIDRHFNHGTETSKMASFGEQASNVVQRAGQLLAGGKKMPTMVGNQVHNVRPGNHLGQFTHATNKGEALKSLGARAALGAGAVGAGAGIHSAMSGNDKMAAETGMYSHVNPKPMASKDKMGKIEVMKKADLHDAKKMKQMAMKEEKEEKAEEKVHPGIHKEVDEKTANAIAHLAGVGALAGLGYHGYNKGRELAESGAKKIDDISLPGIAFATLPYGAYRLGKEYGYDKHRQSQTSEAKPTEKLAEMLEKGCTCDGNKECDYCKSKEVMKKIAEMVNSNADTAPPSPTMTGGETVGDPAGQMGAPQPGREKPPGCECNQGQDGMPLCKVCKLQALMEQYMAQKAEQEGAGGAGMQPGPEVPGQEQPVQGLPQ